MKQKRKGEHKITLHHILPKSKGGEKTAENIALVKQGLHRRYHALFQNKTPSEILSFLENYFWNGRVDFILNHVKDTE